MQDDTPEVSPSRASMAPALRILAMLLLVVVGTCIGSAVMRWITQIVTPPAPVPAEVVEVLPSADVIVAIRDLARLETASYHVERVIDLSSNQRRLFGLVEARDTILLVAAADVVAGVDLTAIRDGDIVIEPEIARATLTLPSVEIFSARLDNQRTYVRDRHTDLLAERREGLETRARQEAERTLRQAALEAGIEERARQNARRTLETLLRSLGYRQVTIRFADDVPGLGPDGEPGLGEPSPGTGANGHGLDRDRETR